MIITDIRTRRHRLSAMFLDRSEVPELIDTETLLVSGYSKGQDIDDEALAELKELSDRNRAYEKALYLLEYRPHSKAELFRKLRAVFPQSACEDAAGKIEALGLLDDRSYAADIAEQLVKSKKMAPRKVKYELQKRGIEREIIDDILESITEETDFDEQIEAVIRKKYWPLPDDPKGMSRVNAGLARMGYNYSDIRSVLDRLRND